MTDGEALLAAIVADPAEDVPRLAFADWCDENDRPEQGVFIRTQVDAFRLDPYGSGVFRRLKGATSRRCGFMTCGLSCRGR